MRGRGGLGRIHRMMQMNENVKKLGHQIEAKTIDEMKQQIEVFSEKLSEFTSLHKDDIKLNPEFRKEFYMMCTEMGVDPLASKSIWSNTLNLAEFYYELAIQILTISLAIRDKVGALIELNDMKAYLCRIRKKDDISDLDIIKSIESVSELKCGFQVIDLSNNKKAVMTIPITISNDVNIVMQVALENKGYITYYLFSKRLSYNNEAFEAIMKSLIDKGIVWVDNVKSIINPDKEREGIRQSIEKSITDIYWFPGLIS